ncbi:ABC transporter permease [Cytobacillus depressus]|uniref:ABC transporter permease n=1 Tax=Cytobacillus depressus TaxID=1602942 RepID=A0A6L3VEQ3_9BACI|nr:ABC transporter permease subunit [Cytobacillus depressus]KAB2338144.1 ABC transporter permease [Cytobacillus depressus]
MSQWLTLFNKEMLEMSRNFKWIWVPIVFILLAVQEPIVQYYLPEIINSLGDLPEGAVIKLPVPSAAEVLMAILGQFNVLGVLIIVLTSMGIIAGERKSGVAALILVKPVSYFSYITAKWASAMLLLWVSYFAGYIFSYYYVVVLFEAVSFSVFLQSFFMNGIWLSFVLTITIFLNSLFRSPGAVGFLSITAILLINMCSSLFVKWFKWSPALLTGYTNQFLLYGEFPREAFPALTLAIISIIVLLLWCVRIFRQKELA